MSAAERLFDTLADGYEEHFRVTHRRAYDDLAWELVAARLPAQPSTIVDAGCGIGRWATRLLEAGHDVIGIESAPRMAARARDRLAGEACFRLREQRLEDVELPERSVGAVLAMGSLQFTADPAAVVAAASRWLVPGGHLCTLVDSRLGLVIELVRAGRVEEATLRADSKRGRWVQHGQGAELHLLDRTDLEQAFRAAGLIEITSHGLLVSATTIGREALVAALDADYEGTLTVERELARHPPLADLGKQLLTIGRAPARSPAP